MIKSSGLKVLQPLTSHLQIN